MAPLLLSNVGTRTASTSPISCGADIANAARSRTRRSATFAGARPALPQGRELRCRRRGFHAVARPRHRSGCPNRRVLASRRWLVRAESETSHAPAPAALPLSWRPPGGGHPGRQVWGRRRRRERTLRGVAVGPPARSCRLATSPRDGSFSSAQAMVCVVPWPVAATTKKNFRSTALQRLSGSGSRGQHKRPRYGRGSPDSRGLRAVASGAGRRPRHADKDPRAPQARGAPLSRAAPSLDKSVQLDLFDERNLFAHYPGERMVACRNPDLAKIAPANGKNRWRRWRRSWSGSAATGAHSRAKTGVRVGKDPCRKAFQTRRITRSSTAARKTSSPGRLRSTG